MSEIIVSCAGCCRRYKGQPGPKKFRCTNCDNHLTFPREPHEPIEGTVYCSSCWTGISVTDELAQCPICSQKIDVNAGGGRASWPSGTSGVRAAVNPNEDTRRSSGVHEAVSASGSQPSISKTLEEKLTEYQTRLALWQESQAAVIKERDELAQHRRELEQKVVELSARLDGVTAARDQMMKERDQSSSARQPLELRIAELEAKLGIAADLHAKSEEDIAAARASQRDSDRKSIELEAKLNAAQEQYCAVLNDRNELDSARRQLEVSAAESEARLSTIRDQMEKAQKDCVTAIQSQKGFEDRIVELSARLEVAKEQSAKALELRDNQTRDHAGLEARANELQAKVIQAQQDAAQSRRERDAIAKESGEYPAQIESLKRLLEETARERDEATAERANAVMSLEQQRMAVHDMEIKLRQYQEMAVQALDPLNTEYNRIARELTSESERILAHLLQLESELGLRKERLRSLETALTARLNKACRDAMDRLIAGSPKPANPANESNLSPAIEIPSGMDTGADWHASSTQVDAQAIKEPGK